MNKHLIDHKIPAVIFDLDGTLANCDHRLHYVNGEQKDWDKFFNELINDTVNLDISELAFVLWKASIDIIIVSGRPDSHKQQTINWLDKNQIQFHELHMRKFGEYRQDYIIKQEILQDIRERYHIWFVVDDRQQVVDMWRAEGLTCLQSAPWKEAKPILLPNQIGQTKLIVLIGPSGSGKSTYLRNHSFNSSTIISSDDIRLSLNNGVYVYDATMNYKIHEIAHELINVRLKHGLLTVSDRTNLHRRHRVSLLKLLPEGLKAEYIVFDTTLEKCLSRQVGENRVAGQVPDDGVKRQYETFKQNWPYIIDGDGFKDTVKVTIVPN